MQKFEIDNRTIFRILISTAVFLLLIKVIVLLQTPLFWIAAAFFLAVALNPAVSYLAHFLPRRSRGAAIFVALLVIFVLLAFLLFSFIPPLIDQSKDLVKAAPGAFERLQQEGNVLGDISRHYNLADKVNDFANHAFDHLSAASGSALDILRNIFSGVAAAVTIFTLTFFMLLESPTWTKNFWALMPAATRARNQQMAQQMNLAVTGYVNGNLFTSAIAAVTSGVVMAIAGLPYAVPLALIVGLLDLIPLVGASIAAAIVVIVALFNSVTAAIIMLVFFLIYQQIENNVLQPLIYGKSTELSPLVVTIAILFGAALAGIFGALVAIPIAACIKVILVHLYGKRLKAV